MTPYIIVIIGIGFILLTYVQRKKYASLLKKGKQADGIVFDFESGGQDSPAYPIIRFVTEKQEWVTKTASMNLPSFKQGSKVTVIYDPENPGDFVINPESAAFLQIVFIVLGCAAIIGGVCLLLFQFYSAKQ